MSGMIRNDKSTEYTTNRESFHIKSRNAQKLFAEYPACNLLHDGQQLCFTLAIILK
jgi:hypothetical protein